MKNYYPNENTLARKALEAIKEEGQMTPVALASILGTSPKNIAAILYACIDHKLVMKVGRGNGTYYRMVTEADHVQGISLDLADEPAPADPAENLAISIWSDGDVMVEGATVHTDDNNKIVFSRAQAQQLVRMLARPAVAL